MRHELCVADTPTTREASWEVRCSCGYRSESVMTEEAADSVAAEHRRFALQVEALQAELEFWHKAASVLPGMDNPRSPQDLMDVSAKLARLEAERDEAHAEVARFRTELDDNRDNLLERFLNWRGLEMGEPVCQSCGGSGVRAYPSSSAWRNRPSGQAITSAICDKCWGTGSAVKSGVDLRALEAELARLREAQALLADSETASRMARLTNKKLSDLIDHADLELRDEQRRLAKAEKDLADARARLVVADMTLNEIASMCGTDVTKEDLLQSVQRIVDERDSLVGSALERE